MKQTHLNRVQDSNARAHRVFFFSSRRRHTRFDCDWSSDVCSSDLTELVLLLPFRPEHKAMLVAAKKRESGILMIDAARLFGRYRTTIALDYREARSEERRVGEECRSRWSADH